jgi:hypothetical protein
MANAGCMADRVLDLALLKVRSAAGYRTGSMASVQGLPLRNVSEVYPSVELYGN